MSMEIKADCCDHSEEGHQLEPKETVYIQVGSPATYHGSAMRYECPRCGRVVLEVERAIVAEPTKSLWGEPDE